jgi:nitrate/nitrite-specific signal transduction histidine kinase
MDAVAAVSFALDNRPIGGIWIARKDAKPYSEADLIWLEYMADQVVIAIQHGLMTSQLQSLSITEERARIAREMHDGLAQVLGYLNLQVQTLDALLKQDRRADLAAELIQMRQAISVANADVRENILSLRTTLASEKGLASAIDEYLQEFGIQTGIETEFVNKVDGNLDIASVAEVQLVCILQEALANVRKHAQATHVNVLIDYKNEQETDYIYMRVLDDGIGFATQDSRRSFGLKTMQERAHGVQGRVSVHSSPGQGTRIECYLPCLSQQKLERNHFWLTTQPDTLLTD